MDDNQPDSYTKSLEDMLMHMFNRIEKSKNPEENMKWFVSKEAAEWYFNYKDFIEKEKAAAKEEFEKEDWIAPVFGSGPSQK